MDPFELGSDEKPNDVGGVGAFSMDKECDLVGLVPDQLLLGLPTRGEASD
jgi:hypothetical protein